MGRTDGRSARAFSLFQADVPRALRRGRRGCLGAAVTHMPLLRSSALAPACTGPLPFSPPLSQAQIKLNRTNREGEGEEDLLQVFPNGAAWRAAGGRRRGRPRGRNRPTHAAPLAGELLHTAAAWKQALWL